MNNVKEQVKEFLSENFIVDDIDQIEDDTSFLENGIIDSTGVLELITFLEESFSIKVLDEEIIPENLDSFTKIENYVNGKV